MHRCRHVRDTPGLACHVRNTYGNFHFGSKSTVYWIDGWKLIALFNLATRETTSFFPFLSFFSIILFFFARFSANVANSLVHYSLISPWSLEVIGREILIISKYQTGCFPMGLFHQLLRCYLNFLSNEILRIIDPFFFLDISSFVFPYHHIKFIEEFYFSKYIFLWFCLINRVRYFYNYYARRKWHAQTCLCCWYKQVSKRKKETREKYEHKWTLSQGTSIIDRSTPRALTRVTPIVQEYWNYAHI